MIDLADCRLRFDVTDGDSEQVRSIVAATNFFSHSETDIAVELVLERIAKGAASGYEFILADDSSGLIAYACFGEIPCTVGSYDIYWIVVSPARQRSGLGRKLMQLTERRIEQLHGRRIYIDTSGRPKYAPTRAFYHSCGYYAIADLPDFYAVGDSKIIFTKTISER